jgi:DNA-binding IclR family transcriptional regulator
LDDLALSELVISFVTAHLRTVDDLHLLVAMAGAQDRWFDADRVARELGITPSHARTALERLASQNLLEIRVTADIRYQFHPGTPELLAAANGCVEAYRRNPMALWRLASEQLNRRGVRDFADAFRIRRDDDR